MKPAPTQITVSRTLPSDIGTRDVILLLDTQPLATLRYGESVTRDIAPGPHTLHAHNTLKKQTVQFDVQPGAHVRFVTANYAGFWTWVGILLGAGPIYIMLQQEGNRRPE
jgi:hypothetical protein